MSKDFCQTAVPIVLMVFANVLLFQIHSLSQGSEGIDVPRAEWVLEDPAGQEFVPANS